MCHRFMSEMLVISCIISLTSSSCSPLQSLNFSSTYEELMEIDSRRLTSSTLSFNDIIFLKYADVRSQSIHLPSCWHSLYKIGLKKRVILSVLVGVKRAWHMFVLQSYLLVGYRLISVYSVTIIFMSNIL